MVFGNMGDDSATGVAFTRNPSTGKNEIFGEYLINAQGEDVVAGTRTPQYITKKAINNSAAKEKSITYQITGVQLLMFKLWCLETWVMIVLRE